MKEKIIKIQELEILLQEIKKEYNKKIEEISNKIDEEKLKLNIINNGLDLSKIELAKKCLSIYGFNSYDEIGKEGHSMIKEVINEIAKNDFKGKFKDEYYGIKYYSGFGPQRSDHGYGYGPKHGSIFFSIGAQDKYKGKEMTKDENEAVLYLLINLETYYKLLTK